MEEMQINKIALMNVYAEQEAQKFLAYYFGKLGENCGIEAIPEMTDFYLFFAEFIRGGARYGYLNEKGNLNPYYYVRIEDLIYMSSLNPFASNILKKMIEEKVLGNSLNDEGITEIITLYKNFVDSGCYEKIEVTDEMLEEDLRLLEALFEKGTD